MELKMDCSTTPQILFFFLLTGVEMFLKHWFWVRSHPMHCWNLAATLLMIQVKTWKGKILNPRMALQNKTTYIDVFHVPSVSYARCDSLKALVFVEDS